MRARSIIPVAAGLLGVLGLAAGAQGAGAAAPGAPVTSANACKYSYNNEFRPQRVTLMGRGSPANAAPGSTVTLSGAAIAATLPPSLPETGYGVGIFRRGANPMPARVWVAIAASNTVEQVRVVALSVTASTRIVTAPGGALRSGTPITVSIPIPEQTWTVAGPGPVTFAQAPAGTLPPLPVGLGDRWRRCAPAPGGRPHRRAAQGLHGAGERAPDAAPDPHAGRPDPAAHARAPRRAGRARAGGRPARDADAHAARLTADRLRR